MSRRWRPRFSGVLIGLGVGVGLLVPSIASAALPAGYDVQRVDSPNVTVGGDFGIAMISSGDLNNDGKRDLVIGTDEHGGSVGQIFEISGADGSTIRTINAPDLDASNPAGNTLPSFGSFVGGLADLGSCSGGTAGVACPENPIGGGDGVPEILVTALGVDVSFTDPDTMAPATLVDAGRAYVIDGATGAILKRIQMPVGDLDDQLDAPGGAKKPAFGRTILSPSSQFGAGNAAAPAAVQIGDVTGGGSGDFIVGASDFFETGATANRASDCATSTLFNANPDDNQCLQAGRGYVFKGEDVAGQNPGTILDAPLYTVKNLWAQADDLTTPVNTNRESMGYSVAPVGDLGACPTGSAGTFCPTASSTGSPDGRPDIALSSHRTDEFGMFDVGVFMLLDGTNGSVLYTYHHPEPQPASLFAFSNYNQPAFGDLGQSTAPDIYQAAMRQNNPYTGGGKGYVMNGAFKQGGSPNSISFSTMVDPTPHPSEDFGTSSAGIGNVFGDSRNELLIGAYGPHNPGTATDTINDVHIFDPIHEVSLLDIQAPDQQPGLGFGTSLAPLGDLNGDGFLDLAVGAGLFDEAATGGGCPTPPALCADTGRVYIFRSNNTASSPAPGATPAVVQAGRALSLKASKRKVKKGGKFRLSGVLTSPVNPSSCAVGQSVTLERQRPGGSGFAPSGATTTDSTGAFSLRINGKRTFRYMAHVDPTATCGGADSNAVKVKVKK